MSKYTFKVDIEMTFLRCSRIVTNEKIEIFFCPCLFGQPKKFDMALYAKKVFGMFGGEEQIVKLECSNNLAGVMIDRFGKDIRMSKLDENHFTVNVKVAVSRHFLAWVIALGEGVRIVGPEAVLAQMREEAERLVRQYQNTDG